MAINLGSIEEIRNSFARVRKDEPYSKPIVAAEIDARNAEHQAAVAHLAGSERMINASTYIAGASNLSPLLDLVTDFNKVVFKEHAHSNAHVKNSPGR